MSGLKGKFMDSNDNIGQSQRQLKRMIKGNILFSGIMSVVCSLFLIMLHYISYTLGFFNLDVINNWYLLAYLFIDAMFVYLIYYLVKAFIRGFKDLKCDELK